MTNFNTYIEGALAKGHKALAKRMQGERRMAGALVTVLLDKGYTISVHNGEEWALVRGKAYRKVMDVLWQTDEEMLLVRDAAGEKVGRFYLVYGNSGAELIQDYTDNEACNEVWKALETVRNRLEEGR